VSAQDPNTGRIRGRVVLAPSTIVTAGQKSVRTSESRTPLGDVPVTIVDADSKVEVFHDRTDAAGYFESGPLPAKNYRVVISGNDLLSEIVTVYSLRTDEVVIEVSGTVSETRGQGRLVTPIGQTPFRILTQNRNLTDARRDGAYIAKTANEFSLGGSSLTRSFDELAFYIPGIASPPQSLSSLAGPGFGAGIGTSGQFSANGLRSRANNFTVDGADNNDEDIGVRRQGFLSLVPQPVESIHEYQVITAAAPAQVGRNLGAQVNAVSQYGTRNVHGSLYSTLSSHLFNSADFFDTTGGNTTIPLTALVDGSPRAVHINRQPQFVTNGAGRKDRFAFAQLGSTLSGPLWRAKSERDLQLFYFVSFEFQRLRATKETHFAVPTVEERGLSGSGATGLTRDPFTGASLDAYPTSAQGDAVFSLFPFPNNPEGIYKRNTFTQELPADGLGIIASGRLDGSRMISNRLHQFIGRYNFTDDYRDLPTVAGALFSTVRPNVRAQNFSLFVNSFLNQPESSSIVSNQFFVSYGRTGFDFEERRDNGFLSPSRVNLTNPEERRFLLNAPLLENRTRRGSSVVEYVRSDTVFAEARLGTPFELIEAPVGQIIIAGFSPVGVDVFTLPQTRTNNTYQAADTMTVQTGDHALAFGADVRRSELNSRLPRNARPLILFSGGGKAGPRLPDGTRNAIGRFSALDVAATGAPNGVLQTLTTGDDSTIGLRYYQYNFFARDEWRVRPTLSLSFGLRYEYNTPPREQHRRIEQTFNSPILEAVKLDAFINRRERIFAPDRNNFAPRLGLAYSFGRNDRNVIRIGAGTYYDQAPGVVVSQSRSVVPTFVTFNTAGFFEAREDGTDIGLGIVLPSTLAACGNSGRVPISAAGTLNTIHPLATVSCILDVYLVRELGGGFVPVLQTVLPADDLEMPTAYHYTASFEREFGSKTFFSVAYVGTQGRHLLRQTTPNLGDHSPTGLHTVIITDGRPRFAGQIDQPQQRDATGVLHDRLSPKAGTVRLYESSANSRYDALQLQATRRLVNGTTFQFNYTLSKATDHTSDVFELAGAPALPQNSLTRAGERSYANFDARHIFSGYLTYAFRNYPSESEPGLRKFFLGGWQVTGKVRYQTGQPFTVNTVKDINRDGNLTDRPNTTQGIVETGDRRQPLVLSVDPNTILAHVSEDGAVGRNTFRAGGRFEIDLSLMKNFVFESREHYDRRLSFRLDIFNLTNRANFGVPIRHLEAPGFGTAFSTVTPSRRLQFSLKLAF
jgi:hypothetical protein